jgi:hypothetical protein
MSRRCSNWLESFMEFSSYGEAPRHVYFWVGACTLAGALRRKVWLDQIYFQWYPNLYVVLVAPPGIVSKSTTAEIGMSLLRQVPNIKFGPAVITWQALVQSFEAALESFEYNQAWHPMSPMTIASSEFGNLLNPADKEMVDMLVNLWDGKTFEKKTKMSGDNKVINPWINLIACTTPEWIAGSFPEYMIGGGFTSRCVWVYADTKEKYVAYPSTEVPVGHAERQAALVADLEHISTALAGPYTLTPQATQWGTDWYERHYKIDAQQLDPSRYGGYVARKQTHMHKLAMILAASESDERVITEDHLKDAFAMVTTLEADMPKVFDRIGSSRESIHLERLTRLIMIKRKVSYDEVYRTFSRQFPLAGEMEQIISSVLKTGLVRLENTNKGMFLMANDPGAHVEASQPQLDSGKAVVAEAVSQRLLGQTFAPAEHQT